MATGRSSGRWLIDRLDFEFALGDVDILLRLHDSKTGRSKGRPVRDLEVFKRAGVILAVTAWETFIEEVLNDAFTLRLNYAQSPGDVSNTFNAVAQAWLERGAVKPPELASWALDGWKALLRNKLQEDLASFHTPNTENIRKIFKRYLDEDITQSWRWKSVSSTMAGKSLDALIQLRGKLVHKGRDLYAAKASVRRGDVVNASSLLRKLAERTEAKLETLPWVIVGGS